MPQHDEVGERLGRAASRRQRSIAVAESLTAAVEWLARCLDDVEACR